MKTVLVVDDEPQIAEIATDYLRLAGYEAIVATDGIRGAGGRRVDCAEVVAKSIVIRVSDSGPGIPAEELPHLFDRFQKGRQSRGTGLGLAIARKLVLAHGGEVQVESTEGVGTTVTVSLRRSSG